MLQRVRNLQHEFRRLPLILRQAEAAVAEAVGQRLDRQVTRQWFTKGQLYPATTGSRTQGIEPV